jgi:prevent-host-death family protein
MILMFRCTSKPCDVTHWFGVQFTLAWHNSNMVAISLSEIQRDLPAYLRRVEAGESLLITDHDRPVAELKPVSPTTNSARPVGLCAGEFRVPDDIDDPLPVDILREFGCR